MVNRSINKKFLFQSNGFRQLCCCRLFTIFCVFVSVRFFHTWFRSRRKYFIVQFHLNNHIEAVFCFFLLFFVSSSKLIMSPFIHHTTPHYKMGKTIKQVYNGAVCKISIRCLCGSLCAFFECGVENVEKKIITYLPCVFLLACCM